MANHPRKPSHAVLVDPIDIAALPEPGAAAIVATPAPEVVDLKQFEPPPPPPSSAGVKRAPHYRVKVGRTVSWYGQTIRLHPGDVLSDESYGPGGMARLMESGAELEEVPPPS